VEPSASPTTITEKKLDSKDIESNAGDGGAVAVVSVLTYELQAATTALNVATELETASCATDVTTSACVLAKSAKTEAAAAEKQINAFILAAQAGDFDPQTDSSKYLQLAEKAKNQVTAAADATAVVKQLTTAMEKVKTDCLLPESAVCATSMLAVSQLEDNEVTAVTKKIQTAKEDVTEAVAEAGDKQQATEAIISLLTDTKEAASTALKVATDLETESCTTDVTTVACVLAKSAKTQAAAAEQQTETFIVAARAKNFKSGESAKAYIGLVTKLQGQITAADEATDVVTQLTTAMANVLADCENPMSAICATAKQAVSALEDNEVAVVTKKIETAEKEATDAATEASTGGTDSIPEAEDFPYVVTVEFEVPGSYSLMTPTDKKKSGDAVLSVYQEVINKLEPGFRPDTWQQVSFYAGQPTVRSRRADTIKVVFKAMVSRDFSRDDFLAALGAEFRITITVAGVPTSQKVRTDTVSAIVKEEKLEKAGDSKSSSSSLPIIIGVVVGVILLAAVGLGAVKYSKSETSASAPPKYEDQEARTFDNPMYGEVDPATKNDGYLQVEAGKNGNEDETTGFD
jgi:hypothetical protein